MIWIDLGSLMKSGQPLVSHDSACAATVWDSPVTWTPQTAGNDGGIGSAKVTCFQKRLREPSGSQSVFL